MKYIPILNGFSAGFCFSASLDSANRGDPYSAIIFMAFVAANIFMAVRLIKMEPKAH